jgi:asparagine synthase (glutamine-hydrolysing)
MCGITGVIRKGNPRAPFDISTINNLLKHRGPDGAGTYSFENIHLGHRRLAIIDLEGGKQPLSNEDGSIWITYNGELYNFLELKSQLSTKGHQFKTHSDTEVIVHAYEEWGSDCVKHFRGMFAFGILDQNKRELFLARDHFGIKPLVYLESPDVFAFASEIQALRAMAPSMDLDYAAIDQYLQFQYIPAPRTVFKQIKKLPAAHFMRVGFDGTIKELRRYWQLDFIPDYAKTETQWLEELNAILYDSVNAHLVSDVPFGAFLSGGVDSSTVVGYMAQIMQQPVKTFSIGFEEDGFDETFYARQVAKKWNTDHHEEIVRPDALGLLPLLARHYGEPFADSSALPTYYVSQLARKHVTMVLTGDAGDETFAGYESYTSRWSRHVSPIPKHLSPVRKLAYKILNGLAPNKFPLRTNGLQDWLRYVQSFQPSQREGLWHADIWSSIPNPNFDVHSNYFDRTKTIGHFQKAQFSDFNTYMVDDILCKVDIASMMHGLETRTPLLDIKVVEFAATIPESLNIRKIGSEWSGKLLLKKLGEKNYSNDLLYRKKMGFATPMKKWLVQDGKATKEIQERLLSEGNGLLEIFNADSLRQLVKTAPPYQVWQLLFLQEWLHQNR